MVTGLPPPAGTPVEAGPVPARRNSPARTTVEPGAVDYGDAPPGLTPPAGTPESEYDYSAGSRSLKQKIVRRPRAGSRSIKQNMVRRPGAGSRSIEQNIVPSSPLCALVQLSVEPSEGRTRGSKGLYSA
jgi:hypothetical protein